MKWLRAFSFIVTCTYLCTLFLCLRRNRNLSIFFFLREKLKVALSIATIFKLASNAEVNSIKTLFTFYLQISTTRTSDSLIEPSLTKQQQLTAESKWLGESTITWQRSQSQHTVKDIAEGTSQAAPAAQPALTDAQLVVGRSRAWQIVEKCHATRCRELQEAAGSFEANPSGGQ